MPEVLFSIFTRKWDCEEQFTHTICACLSSPVEFLPVAKKEMCEHGAVIAFTFHVFASSEDNKHNLLQ